MRLLLGSFLEETGEEVEGELLVLGLHLDGLLEALLGVGEVVEFAEADSEEVEEGGIAVDAQCGADVDLGREVLVFLDEGEGDVGVDVPSEGVEEERSLEAGVCCD